MSKVKGPVKCTRVSQNKKFFLTDIVEGRGRASRGRPASPADPVVDDEEADDHNESHADEDRAVVDVLAKAEVAQELVDAAAAGQLRNDRPGDEAPAAAAEAVDLAVTATSVSQIVFLRKNKLI